MTQEAAGVGAAAGAADGCCEKLGMPGRRGAPVRGFGFGAAIRNPQEPGRDEEVTEAFERWQVRPRRTQQT